VGKWSFSVGKLWIIEWIRSVFGKISDNKAGNFGMGICCGKIAMMKD